VVAKKQSADEGDKVGALDKIARLLAAYVTRDMKPEKATLLMEGAGFTGREITELLGVSDSYVRQVRFQRKAKKGKKKKAKSG
jgi:DNA-directed RNA polymerase specialized sigma24 family protein